MKHRQTWLTWNLFWFAASCLALIASTLTSSWQSVALFWMGIMAMVLWRCIEAR